MANLVDKQAKSNEWFTPETILYPVRNLFGGPIDLDPCTTENNPTNALVYFTEKDNGLTQSWGREGIDLLKIFVNPPHGKKIGTRRSQIYDWIEKTTQEARHSHRIVLLVSASSRWDQSGWQKIFSPYLTAMCMPLGRVKYLDHNYVQQKSPTYPSLLFFYNIFAPRVEACFGHLGKVVAFK
jgi:hypothetical protein